MYERYYKLREKPFNMTPDPEFLFFTEKHKEAFAHLVYGIRERRGFIEITGEVGAGKTTICRALLNEFDTDTKIALILNPFLSDFELLRAINEELYIDASGKTKKELLDTLNRYLIDQHAAGRNVVLMIDEAQNLPPDTLEQIRIISNLETVKAKLIQIVLVGQPELREKLSRSELRQLNQRITVRYHISPLSRSETADYITHRLKVAGNEGQVQFTSEAIERIYKYTGGVPRMINILCDHALLSGFVYEREEIDLELVKKAWHEIEGKELGRIRTWKTRLARHSLAYGGVAVVLLAALAFLAGRGSFRFTPQHASSSVSASFPAVRHEMPRVEPIEPTEPPAPMALTAEPDAADVSVQSVAVADIPAVTPDKVYQEVVEAASPEIAVQEEMPGVVSQDAPQVSMPEMTVEESRPAPMEVRPFTVGKFDDDGILRCQSPAESRMAALLSLGRLWTEQGEALEKIFADRTNEAGDAWVSQVFSPYGLTAISWSTNLAMVRAINLPMVAEVYEGAMFTPQYLVLMGIEKDRLKVGDPLQGLRWITEPEFNRQWFGRLTVMVPKSVKPETILGRGSGGESVRMLQMRLQRLGFFDSDPNGFYGDYTVEQVRRFQQQNRIKIDGLVGLETNLVLFSRLAGTDAPRLTVATETTASAGG